MTEPVELQSALPGRNAPSLVRFIIDFAAGIAVFSIVFGSVSLGHGQALAGSAGWVATVAAMPTHGFWDVVWNLAASVWDVMDRYAVFGVLAVTFGAITAFNMAMARHLRAVALPLQR